MNIFSDLDTLDTQAYNLNMDMITRKLLTFQRENENIFTPDLLVIMKCSLHNY